MGKKINILFPSLMFVLLCTTFLFGSFSKDYKLQNNSNKISDVALTTRSKEVFAVKVESLSEKQLVNEESEYLTLYQAFRLDNYPTFAGVSNSNKEIDYKIEGIENPSTLSFFRFGYASSITYNSNIRHKRYPIELMFEDKPFYDQGYSNIISISKRHADKLLAKQGKVSPYTLEDYKSLTLNSDSPSPINLVYGEGNKYECYIANIYLEYTSNIYFMGLHEVLDDFVITYKTLPTNVKEENLYFFNKYSYQNQYFMNHILDTYKSKSDYKISVVKNNLTTSINEDELLEFYYGDISSTNWVSILTLVLAITLCLVIVMLSIFKYKLYTSKLFNILFISSLLLPYILFRVINAITHSIKYFSMFSTTANIAIVLSLIFIYLVSIGIYKLVTSKRKEKTNNESKNK